MVGGHPRHAMVGNNDEVDVGTVRQLAYAAVERLEQRVDHGDSSARELALRPILVAVGVGLLHVSHDEVGPFLLRQAQLADNAVHALGKRQAGLAVVRVIDVGVATVDFHVGARPIKHSHSFPLPGRRVPDGLASVVSRVCLLPGVGEREAAWSQFGEISYR